MILAIANDIPDDTLRAWKRLALSTTCTFKVLPRPTDRYWYALQQRELISTTHKVVHRSTYQRVHEISRLMKKLRDTLPASEVTAAVIAKAYTDNLQMAPGSASTVTLNFVDCCATITNRLLDVPAIAWCLQDLDERSAFSEDPNPFDSHSRLQGIIDKCRANNQQQLVWVIEGIWYHWRRGNITTLSVADIKGTAQSGNRGYADLMLFKLQLRNAFIAKGLAIFPESADWFSGQVTAATDSFRRWYEHEEQSDKSWRAGRPHSETKFLIFFTSVIFGRAYDGPVKLALKSSKSADEALLSPGLTEYLDEIVAKHSLEQPGDTAPSPETNTTHPRTNDDPHDIVFHLPAADGTQPTLVIKASSVQDGHKREMLDSIINSTRQHIAAQIHLIAQEPDEPHPRGLQAAVMDTPVGKMRGAPMTANPSTSKYIGIFYDPKVAGEANHRPMTRVPPLRAEQVRRLVELTRGRFGTSEVAADEIPMGDLYFLFDGGRAGNQNELLKPFAGKPKSVKTFMLWRDEDSLTQRLQRVGTGIGTYRQHEHMFVVSALMPALKATKLQNYKGSTGGTVIGPIVLPDLSLLWHCRWLTKKAIFTPANLIAVGGRADPDDEMDVEPVRAKPRDKDSVEPVFYHALPETFYSELLGSFPLVGVLDLTPGDGSLAMSAYRRGAVYLGLVFSDSHKTELMQHLEKTIWQAMSTDTDPLFEPRLVAALMGTDVPKPKKAAGKPTPTPKPPKGPPTAKAKATGNPKRGRVADPDDPFPNEGDAGGAEDGDDANDGAHLSGDDAGEGE